MIDEISIVSKKLLYQVHQCLIEIFNLPNILFAGKSILVVGDLYKLQTVHAMPEYARNSDLGELTIYIEDELWRLFQFVELTGPIRDNAAERKSTI